MAAKFADAFLGYEYFLRNRGEVSMGQINQYLEQHSRSPIQLRTFTHYRKLMTHGFRTYVPINKFDVFLSLGKLQAAADRRRYKRETVQIPVNISRDQESWVQAVIVDRSPVGFGVRTLKRFPVPRASTIWVQIEGYDSIPTILVWKSHEESTTRMGLRALQFIANYRVGAEKVDNQRLQGVLRLVGNSEGNIDWEYLVQLLEKSNELISSVSDLIYTITDLSETEVRLARPILQSIQFASPGNAEIKIDFGIADIIKVIFEKLQFWGLDRKKNREEGRRLELENANLQIEIMRNAINLTKEAQMVGFTQDVIRSLIDKPLRNALNIKRLPQDLFREHSVERGILEERILPAATELMAGDDPHFTAEVGPVNDLDEKNKDL